MTGGGTHVIRTAWGSAEVLASAIVANLPPIVGAYHLGRKTNDSTPKLTGITKTTELKLSSLKAKGDAQASVTSRVNSDPKPDSDSDDVISIDYSPTRRIKITDVEHG